MVFDILLYGSMLTRVSIKLYLFVYLWNMKTENYYSNNYSKSTFTIYNFKKYLKKTAYKNKYTTHIYMTHISKWYSVEIN